MALDIKKRLFSEYPIPEQLSIWGGDGISTLPLFDFDDFIDTCIDELRSDLYIRDYINTSAMKTFLPEDAIGVVSGRLNYPFQGNRSVKVQYNPIDHSVVSRFFPLTITYRRRLSRKNLDKLEGDRLIYFKHYVLSRMAEKELVTLGTVDLDADNGKLNLDALSRFAEYHKEQYTIMKDSILLYTVGN